MSRFVQGCLVTLILAGLPVDSTEAGLFDLFRRDCRATRSRCRCSRPHHQHTSCHTPRSQPTPQPTPQPTRQPTPRPTPQPPPTTQRTPRPGTRSFVVTTPPTKIAAQPSLPGSSPTLTPLITRGPGHMQVQPGPASITYRPPAAVIYGREAVISQVPVTYWQTRWVDAGQFRTVWVPRIVARRVPQTTWQSRLNYRLVPYQRMATPGIGVPTTRTAPPAAADHGLVPDPLLKAHGDDLTVFVCTGDGRTGTEVRPPRACAPEAAE